MPSNTEENEILDEYLRMVSVPQQKGSNKFRGYVFQEIISKKIERLVGDRYRVHAGPSWIRGIEEVEWDIVILKRQTGEIDGLTSYFDVEDIIGLFEVKAHGIYGGRNEVRRKLEKEKEKFKKARRECGSLRGCFYISLQERKPRRATAINYFQITKDALESVCTTCILFNSDVKERRARSRPQELFSGEWYRLIQRLKYCF